MKEQHLLVDFENVQPGMEDLLKIAPKLTDVWLFHGPNQTKRAEQLKAAHERVTLVPHSGKGKNALDFHLSFYLGYLAAKHPEANLVVVANDKGYDSMLGHAKLLEFRATRVGFKARKAPAAKKAAPAKKVTAKKAAPAKKVAPPAKKLAAQKAPAKKVPAKTAVAKKAVTKMPASAVQATAQTTPAPADKVLARAKASLAKMGKNRPIKLTSLLRHLKSIVGQGATAEDADALSRRLEEAKVIQVVGDLVLYP
ncbi:PIN domain-containing protein [Hydrogenophaga sp. UC242_50]|uniref:PIN domain-containing protein n=1 Tax=Hydrogenophaga sp. UC242_50 TaxID=3350169 RepID=UPI0036D38A4C